MEEIYSFWAHLGWSKPREVKVMSDGRAYFEIAEQGHCDTCRRRIENFSEAARNSNVDVKFDYLFDRYPRDAKTLWGGIVVPKDATETDVRKLFKEKLNLNM